MSILLSAITIFSAIFVGVVIGYITGFAMSAHPDILQGLKPRTNNKLLLLIARPTASFNYLERVMFIIIMLAWIPVFLGYVLYQR